MDNDIIFKSTEENIREFIKGKDLIALIELYFYITSSDGTSLPPTEMEKDFIAEFFTHEGWAAHLQAIKRPNKGYFTPRNRFDLPMIQSVLSFEINKLSLKSLKLQKVQVENIKNNYKKNLLELKVDLQQAMVNSYHETIFDKVDGFSNLYEVLIDHKLLKDQRNED